MSERAISVRDLAFVRDVLIPRCGWVEGPEVEALVGLRLRIDEVIATFVRERPTTATPATPTEPAGTEQELHAEAAPAEKGEPCEPR